MLINPGLQLCEKFGVGLASLKTEPEAGYSSFIGISSSFSRVLAL
jgi:hypothetical protein